MSTEKQQDAESLEAAMQQTEERRSLCETAARKLGVTPSQLCNMLRNVWKTSNGEPPLTDQEMFTGISMIARYDLDPIAREVYVSRSKKGGLFTIVSIDGWIKILDRTSHYDGFMVEIHEDASGNVDWVETAIYSKKRSKPAVYRAYAKEYAKLSGYMAGMIPLHMLRIFCLRHAARLFTPVGGNILTEEEANFALRQADREANPATPEMLEKVLEASRPRPATEVA